MLEGGEDKDTRSKMRFNNRRATLVKSVHFASFKQRVYLTMAKDAGNAHEELFQIHFQTKIITNLIQSKIITWV